MFVFSNDCGDFKHIFVAKKRISTSHILTYIIIIPLMPKQSHMHIVTFKVDAKQITTLR